MLHAELVTASPRLETLHDAWDALAIRRERPFCAPDWQLAWWRNAAPEGAALRAVVVFDADELAGIAPFYCSEGEYRLPAATISAPVEPLVREGTEREAAALIAAELARADPPADRVLLEGTPVGSPWPGLLQEHLRAWKSSRATEPAPAVRLEGQTYEEWLAGKTSHFRKRMRAARRRLADGGATFQLAERPEEVDVVLESLVELHRRRWEGKGDALDDQTRRMLSEAASEFAGKGRLRLWSIQAGGELVAAELFVAAGGEVASLLGAYDERWAQAQPSLQALLAAIEHAFAAGDRRFDLGYGGQDFKYRLADHELAFEWVTLIPKGRGYVRRRLAYVPTQLRELLRRVLSPRQKRLIKRVLGRGS